MAGTGTEAQNADQQSTLRYVFNHRPPCGYLGGILNQKGAGDCAIFAIKVLLEALMSQYYRLSVSICLDDLRKKVPKRERGWIVPLVLHWIMKHGVLNTMTRKRMYPVARFLEVKDYNKIKDILKRCPLLLHVHSGTHIGWHSPPHPALFEGTSNHLVILSGVGEESGFSFLGYQNSYGPNWAEKGLGRTSVNSPLLAVHVQLRSFDKLYSVPLYFDSYSTTLKLRKGSLREDEGEKLSLSKKMKPTKSSETTSEPRFLRTVSASSFRSLLPRTLSSLKHKSNFEDTPPTDPNIDASPVVAVVKPKLSEVEDVFKCVGVPLVRNSLAGYNTSIVPYGQSGSGKSYTLWGPPSSMVDEPYATSSHGIIPRVFQMLFSKIEKELNNPEGKQINFQCRCSFLDMYNEQIGDLLNPMQWNLEIKDDSKYGLHVENLTEEYVTGYEDVMQMLIKGLSSRKVGATRVNSKRSTSHIVFTFIIESWCKDTSSKCFGSSKTSKICFVELAGLDRKKIDVPGSAKEARHVKKSLVRLGHLVNTLAKESESEKPKDVLYKGSCLTHLLRESLGGNSQFALLCAISPDNNNDGKILKTLRFGERLKCIKNEPVVNEITEDDVNDLSDQIRQLKEELIRAKSSSNSAPINHGYFRGRNVRDSFNLFRVSLNRSLLLPHINNESNELNIDEDDVKELQQLNKLRKSCEENMRDQSFNGDSTQISESCETEYLIDDDCVDGSEEAEIEEMKNIILEDNLRGSKAIDSEFRRSISVSGFKPSILQEPMLSESPKISKNQRKILIMSSSYSVAENPKVKSEELRQSVGQNEIIRSSLRSSKIFSGPAESLEASLQRGLDIVEHYQRNSAVFPFEHSTLWPCPEVDEATSIGQTFICNSCRKQVHKDDSDEVKDSLKTWIVPADEEAKKDMNNPIEEITKREQLESRCSEQAAKIEQLTHLIEQYEREGHHVVSMKNEIIPFVEAGNEVNHLIKDQNKIFRSDSEENYEIKEVQNESLFDANEKEALLKEIQILKSKLQSQQTDSTLEINPIQLGKSSIFQISSDNEELETEMESEWVSLTDELRIDIDTYRRRAEKLETELKLKRRKT